MKQVTKANKKSICATDMGQEIGNRMAKILQLKQNKNGTYTTLNGDKTALGLYRVIAEILITRNIEIVDNNDYSE